MLEMPETDCPNDNCFETLSNASFDNFNDDLCQLILSYLDLDDKIRLECVSKQWRRLIYNSVLDLDYPLDQQTINLWFWHYKDEMYKLRITAHLIQKCQNIKRLNVSPVCDNQTLELIAQNSKSLNTIIGLRFDNPMPIKSEIFRQFAENCGNSLKYIQIEKFSEDQFNSESGLSLFADYCQLFPNLQNISLCIDSLKSFVYFKKFVEKFSQRIKSLELRLKVNTSYKQLNETFEQISRFSQLQNIQLKLECDQPEELELRFGAQLLAKNCPKLKSVSLELRQHFQTSKTKILESLESLSLIQTLELKIRSKHIDLGSFESLKTLKQLTELNILYHNLNDTHLENIHLNCPQIKSIELKTMQILSDRALYSLAKLDLLQKLGISYIPYKLTDITNSGVCALANKYANELKRIDLNCGISIGDETFTKLKTMAESLENCKKIRFSFCWKRSEEQNQSLSEGKRINCVSADLFWPQLDQLPQNLIIKSREYFCGRCGTNMVSEQGDFKVQFNYPTNGEDNKRPKESIGKYFEKLHKYHKK